MTFATTVLMLFLAASESAKAQAKDVRGVEELHCDKVKVVEVADDQDGNVGAKTPTEIPLDTKLVTIRKNALSVQPMMERGKPALALQTFRIVNMGQVFVYAVQESATNVTALALDRATGRMVLSRATAGDKTAPGVAGHIAYFRCGPLGK